MASSAVSITTTSAIISYYIQANSPITAALANVYFGTSTSYGTTVATNQGVGTTGSINDGVSGLQPTTYYYFEVTATATCTDNSGTHTYTGLSTGSWKTLEFPDWTTVLLSDSLTVQEGTLPHNIPVTCTESFVTNLTIQATDVQSGGTWSFSAGPYAQYSFSYSGGCLDFSTNMNSFADQTIQGASGVIHVYSWNPSFTLQSITVYPQETANVLYQLSFYASDFANATVSENKVVLLHADYTILFTIVDLIGIFTGG